MKFFKRAPQPDPSQGGAVMGGEFSQLIGRRHYSSETQREDRTLKYDRISGSGLRTICSGKKGGGRKCRGPGGGIF